jgi:hypothetical protein
MTLSIPSWRSYNSDQMDPEYDDREIYYEVDIDKGFNTSKDH